MMRRFQFLVGFLVFVFGTNQAVYAAPDNQVVVSKVITNDKGPLGVWDYEVEGREDAYGKGVLFVRLENGKHFVEVHLGTGVINGQDVQVEGNTLKFIVIINGVERVSVVLNAKDDAIQGQASSAQGSLTVTGARKLPPQ